MPADTASGGGLQLPLNLLKQCMILPLFLTAGNRLVFLDFAKAFDKVPDDKLLFRLKSILNIVTDWIANYLNGRSQFVHVNAANSSLAPVLSGIPQGSDI